MERIVLRGVVPEVFAGKDGRWDFVFERGECCLVASESGGGKSSMCAYLCGHRRDYRGDILFDDRDIRSFSTRDWGGLRRGSLAVMMQDLRLFPELTAMENVMLKNRLTGMFSRGRVVDFFERLGVGDKVEAPVARLSFGQQQRVAFVRTLCQRADFLLLDEPVSHLDEGNAAAMAAILVEHARALGTGVVVTSIGKHFDMTYHKTFAL